MNRGQPRLGFHAYDVPPEPVFDDGHEPTQFFASGSQDDNGDADDNFLLGMLPPIPAGYLLSTLVAVEGFFVLLDMSDPFGGTMTGVGKQNPWYHTQWLLLEILGLGDLCAAGLGVVGLWLAKNPLPPILNKFIRWDVVLSLTGVGSLVAWRFLVVMAVVPWVGVTLVFEPAEYIRWPRILGAAIYLAFNSYILLLLMAVFRAASEENQRNKEERQTILHSDVGEHGPKQATHLFGCLPLEGTVGLHMLVLLIGSILLLIKVFSFGTTGGGWVFFSHFASVTSETYWMEVIIYLLTIVFSFLGGFAVIIQRSADLDEDYESAKTTQKNTSAAVLAFFLVDLLRFAFYVPITGMALAAGDVCGLYVRFMSTLSLEGKLIQASGVHCAVNDTIVFLLMINVIVLDAYLIRGVFLLWQRYRGNFTQKLGAGKSHRDHTHDLYAPIGRAAAGRGDPMMYETMAHVQ